MLKIGKKPCALDDVVLAISYFLLSTAWSTCNYCLSFLLLFPQTLTSVLLLLPFVMSMQSVRILMDLIAVLARLVTMVTAKLAKVGRAAVCTARGDGFD